MSAGAGAWARGASRRQDHCRCHQEQQQSPLVDHVVQVEGNFHTLAIISALSPRQPVQTSHFSPYSVAVEPLFSHRGVTATSQMASRWLLCCPTNGLLLPVDVTFTYFYRPQNWPHLRTHQFIAVSFTYFYGSPMASLSSSHLIDVTFTFK